MVFGATLGNAFTAGLQVEASKDHENMATAIEFWAFVASEERRRKDAKYLGPRNRCLGKNEHCKDAR